ncbi:BEL1-like homeodomain protein 9 [Ipomoea triloba]|uniref:BEL1-like homeodomain protein 9 n=1 Tax=Ipomoea triloba TaxID=35885 RepID=UPI00125D5EFE|nr:BEL1-like homeodomain protein 9 [Ipomoea triloba]
MAEGFEPYHVPQQSRRDKLRVLVQSHPECVDNNNLHGCAGLAPLYDPPVIPSDLLTCATLHHHHNPLLSDHHKHTGKGASLMMGGSNTTTPTNFSTPTLYMDPQSSVPLHLNQEITRNPFLYASPQSLRFHDNSFHGGGGEVTVVYKPEPLSVAHETTNINNVRGQGLSLTLSSHHTHQHQSASSLPLELNLQRYDASMTSGLLVSSIHGGDSNCSTYNHDGDLSRSCSVPGPFTGYASILKGSRFLKPAQQLLEEVCDVVRGVYAEKLEADSALMDPSMETLSGSSLVDDSPNCNDGGEHRRKKSRLISMLDEVYRRYKQYYQQLQAVVASFESVAGLNNAAPFANIALKAMSKHFRCLKDAITEQLQFTGKSQGHMSFEGEASPSAENLGKGLYFQSTAIHNAGIMEHQPVWRPQRGLPERAVTVLRAWLFDHFLHPYPTDTDKLMLAKQTGLSRNQVSNWFINARVRLWKPMVEEIHNLETRQAQKNSQPKEQNNNNPSEHLSMRNSVACEDASASMHQIQELPTKRTRNEAENSMGSDEAMDLSYGNLSHHSRLGIGGAAAAGSSSVSLTLGLHQNNELGLSDSFPVNAAQRFGLDASSEGFVLSGFEPQNTQFGRDIIGG